MRHFGWALAGITGAFLFCLLEIAPNILEKHGGIRHKPHPDVLAEIEEEDKSYDDALHAWHVEHRYVKAEKLLVSLTGGHYLRAVAKDRLNELRLDKGWKAQSALRKPSGLGYPQGTHVQPP
jgi:hypothetical protein